MKNLTKTKIIATLGPETSTEEKLRELINAGANVFRLNTSHETADAHAERIRTIRGVASSMNKHVAILLDLQGPKIRVGNLIEPMELNDGDMVVIKPSIEQEDPNIIPVDYAGIVKDARPGDRILLDDGKLEFKVISTTTEVIHAEVIHGGLLKKRKGLNIPGATTSVSAVTPRDIEFIKFGVEHNVDYIALSFVRMKDDILKARQYIRKYGGDIPIIAKIEKPQALENLASIISASDGIMVARGDLGIEISPEKVPMVQKNMINLANAHRKTVIVATQMLESMIEQPMPTRAEASDVANAIIDGADAIMLSGETAMGKYPVEAVSMMTMIAQNVETSGTLKSNRYELESKEVYGLDLQAITKAVIRMIDEVEVTAIVVFTKTGYTARLLAKARPSVPIIAISDSEEVCRKANLFWDVFPHKIDCKEFNADLLHEIDKMLLAETHVKIADKVIITGSIPDLAVGRTNFIRLHQVGSNSAKF